MRGSGQRGNGVFRARWERDRLYDLPDYSPAPPLRHARTAQTEAEAITPPCGEKRGENDLPEVVELQRLTKSEKKS